MTIQKPRRLTLILSRELSRDDLAIIAEELNYDVDNLMGSKSSSARQLIQHASNRNRIDQLLTQLASLMPSLDIHPYLYLLVEKNFASIPAMQALSAAVGIDYQKQLVENLGYHSASDNPDVIERQAWEIYRALSVEDRLGVLVWALQEKVPALDLTIFAQATPPVPPAGQQSGPANELNGDGGDPPPIQAMVYDNFDLRINDGQDDVYEVEVLYSPQGQVPKQAQTYPLNETEFKDLLAYLKDLWASADDAQSLGQKMLPLLFPAKVWAKFLQCRTDVQGKGQGLRIRLRIDPPELSRLPWEYVFDADQYDYLAHDKLTPLVRYPAESLAESLLEVEFPIRILLVTANPSDLNTLKVNREIELVQEALEPLIATELAHVDVIDKAQIGTVRTALTDGGYHVLHFVGHGQYKEGKGALLLENATGEARPVAAAQLRAMLRNTGVRFIFLNACETAAHTGGDPISGVARSLIRAGIPAVMAMQFEVPDATSLLLSRVLYQSLVLGKPLDQAVTEMRRAAFIDTEDMVFWGIPVLYMRAPDGVIWQVDETAAAKLAAYKPESPLLKALQQVAAGLSGVQGDLDTDAWQEVEQDLQKARELAEKEDLSEAEGRLLKVRLTSIFGLLEVYGIDENNPVMVALARAKGLS